MNKSENQISTLEDYITIIIKKFRKIKINDFGEKGRIFFRGQSDISFPLLPSIARRIGKTSHEDYLKFEGKMIETAKLQNPEEFADITYPINMLAKMQHYGLPTRLLDVTENALAALYFACNERFDYDGEVLCFVVDQTMIHSSYSLYANIAASLYTQPHSEIDLHKYLNTVRYEAFFPRAERDKSLEVMADYVINMLNTPFFVLPEMLSEREKRQQSAFIVFPNDLGIEGEDNKATFFKNKISDIKETREPEISATLIIPAKRKKPLQRQLELFGISEQFLFPETEKKCKAIKKNTENLVNEKYDILEEAPD